MMTEGDKANAIVRFMYEQDAYSQQLGMEVAEVRPGFCRVVMQVRKEMTNGFKIAHGGITYALADSAFAFASNSHGVKCVSIETSISHQEAVQLGDQLIATAEEIKLKNKVAWYQVRITNQDNLIVAHFTGTVYRTSARWEV